jgi:ribonuclease HI
MPADSEPPLTGAELAGQESGVVEIWTDGGCKPNPGPGGWGAILRYGGHERELSGAERATTNNRMELTAATRALETLKRPCVVRLHTDSEYLKNGVTRWHTDWVRRNWRTSTGQPVANIDLWQRLLEVAALHKIDWHWVRSHVGNPMNERADALATAAREKLREQ